MSNSDILQRERSKLEDEVISREEIKRLEDGVWEVIISKFEAEKLPYYAEVIIHEDTFTTGVQAEEGTYCPLVEITLFKDGRVIYDEELIRYLGTEIPNRVRNTNRVVITIPTD